MIGAAGGELGELIIAGGFAQLIVLATLTAMMFLSVAGCIGWVVVRAFLALAIWLRGVWGREEAAREMLRIERRREAAAGRVVRP